jgi:hypothetical protein
VSGAMETKQTAEQSIAQRRGNPRARTLKLWNQMTKIKETDNSSGVDKGLVAMFLKMTPEERLRANDNAVRAILELRNAYQQKTLNKSRSQLTS